MKAVQGSRSPLRGLLLALVLLAAVAALAACGDDSNDRNTERPPVPLNVSVVIGQDDISASPAKFGAGPITLLVSNQSGASRTLNIDGTAADPVRRADPARGHRHAEGDRRNPATLQLAAADTEGVKPVRIAVGPKRPSAQNQLQLP